MDKSEPANTLTICFAPPTYSVGIFLSAILVFVVACFVVARCKRPGPLACFLLLTPFPLIIGIIGSYIEVFSAWEVVGASWHRAHVQDFFFVFSRALHCVYLGFFGSLPAFAVTAIGLLVRTLKLPQQPPAAEPPSPSGSSKP